jgi:hypothetical protein
VRAADIVFGAEVFEVAPYRARLLGNGAFDRFGQMTAKGFNHHMPHLGGLLGGGPSMDLDASAACGSHPFKC